MTENKEIFEPGHTEEEKQHEAPVPPDSGSGAEESVKEAEAENVSAEETKQNLQISTSGQAEQFRFAGFWMRFWAYLIDLIVIGSIGRIILKPILKAAGAADGSSFFSPLNVGTAVIFYLYFVLMTKYLSQTLGKMVLGLKVVSLKENRLTWGTVIFREFIGRFINKTILILYFLVGFLPKKQGLHDIFADTGVVHE